MICHVAIRAVISIIGSLIASLPSLKSIGVRNTKPLQDILYEYCSKVAMQKLDNEFRGFAL
jgi:hypothetical protein